MREQLTDNNLVDEILADFQSAEIDDTTKAILKFAVKVTEAAYSIRPTDLNDLRNLGLTDETLFAIVEIVGFFSYVNRMADAFGVELDDFLDQE
ncbi:hypothetical protein JT359_10220 [Candidatus Poribacteria bacterium]|nr:hypothetical protein [Candidatus Poribacteria bacterium]